MKLIRKEEIEIIKKSNLIGFSPQLSTPILTYGQVRKVLKSRKNEDPRNESFFEMLQNTLFPSFKLFSLTSFVILINLSIYISLLWFGGLQAKSEFLAPREDLLFKYGSNYPYFIHQNFELYRLVFSLFLHKNLVNLILSTLGLLLVGHALEETMGSKKFIVIYLIAGIIGNLFGNCFSAKTTIGSATCVFGIIGAHFGALAKNCKNITDSKGVKSHFVYLSFLTVLLNFVMGIGLTRVNTISHLGALSGGVFMSMWGYVETQSTKYERKCSLTGKVLFWAFIIFTNIKFFFSEAPSLY